MPAASVQQELKYATDSTRQLDRAKEELAQTTIMNTGKVKELQLNTAVQEGMKTTEDQEKHINHLKSDLVLRDQEIEKLNIAV
jgi:hypothetical protein